MQMEVKDLPIGSPGKIGDFYTANSGQIDSATNEEESAQIPFGVMVQKTATRNAKLLSGSSQDLLGISVHGHAYPIPAELGDMGAGVADVPGLKPGTTFGVGRKGRFWVRVEAAVALTDEVHVRAVADPDADEIAGAFRGTDDGADTIDISDFAEWIEAGDEVALVEIDMSRAAGAVADS